MNSTVPSLSKVPQCFTSVEDVRMLLNVVHSCHLCSGNSDDRFITYISEKNGKIMNAPGTSCYAVQMQLMIPL